jgi:hypothetical protein
MALKYCIVMVYKFGTVLDISSDVPIKEVNLRAPYEVGSFLLISWESVKFSEKIDVFIYLTTLSVNKSVYRIEWFGSRH